MLNMGCVFLQDQFKNLSGQLLFPALHPGVTVTVSVLPHSRSEKGACMRFCNQLTTAKAHSLVHLFYHLGGCAALTGNVSLYCIDGESGMGESALNPVFLAALKSQDRVGSLLIGRGTTGSGQLDEAEMRVLAELTRVKTFHAKAMVNGDLLVPSGHVHPNSLCPLRVNETFINYVLSAGDYCPALTLEITPDGSDETQLGDFFDALIEVSTIRILIWSAILYVNACSIPETRIRPASNRSQVCAKARLHPWAALPSIGGKRGRSRGMAQTILPD